MFQKIVAGFAGLFVIALLIQNWRPFMPAWLMQTWLWLAIILFIIDVVWRRKRQKK
ncbi:hypothetical protein [Tuberibacillus sp. Marseille-P3662]|uniref:hypothetical protein n=1 Tax=Tuberibacillus sp. Marseille-P3662 TaxID=1965358 RepID=UPI00159431F8|nr:hypothetical protein [Tuberibacillus sp. Marseille-P3662]